MKKWSGTCHVFRVDTENGKNWKPVGEVSGGLSVQVQENRIKTFHDTLDQEVRLQQYTYSRRVLLIDILFEKEEISILRLN